jgi:hypothetical protein
MTDSNSWLWVLLVILGVSLYNAKDDLKETKKLNEHNLSRMRYVESNLLKAKTKITEIKNYNSNSYFQGVEQDIDNALVDVRAEMYDLHANLDKK